MVFLIRRNLQQQRKKSESIKMMEKNNINILMQTDMKEIGWVFWTHHSKLKAGINLIAVVSSFLMRKIWKKWLKWVQRTGPLEIRIKLLISAHRLWTLINSDRISKFHRSRARLYFKQEMVILVFNKYLSIRKPLSINNIYRIE